MDFLLSYLVYLVAFALGAALAWFAARTLVPATTQDEAVAALDARLDEEVLR